jgi:thiosulfate/3-mercaptopyruvate sulfurtransferase
MRHLISADELIRRHDDPALRVVDVRYELADRPAGRRAYAAGHIPGAVFLDLHEDLAGPTGPHGGRHPLPDAATFAATLEAAGIGDQHEVVAVDADSGMFAARLWWMLRQLGHDRARVLDGGLAAYRAAGGPLTRELPAHPPAVFTPRPDPSQLVDRDDVLARLGEPGRVLVDARAGERYRGELEPIDARAGHIPGAINLPFGGNLSGGRFLDREALRRRFASLVGAGEVVVYCGSGVTACHDILAMAEAGLPVPRLYAGSWSDWSSYDDAPIATGEDG